MSVNCSCAPNEPIGVCFNATTCSCSGSGGTIYAPASVCQSPSNDGGGGGVDANLVIGVLVSVLVFVVFTAVFVYFCYYRRRFLSAAALQSHFTALQADTDTDGLDLHVHHTRNSYTPASSTAASQHSLEWPTFRGGDSEEKKRAARSASLSHRRELGTTIGESDAQRPPRGQSEEESDLTGGRNSWKKPLMDTQHESFVYLPANVNPFEQ